MGVSLYPDMLACRFEEPKRAVSLLGRFSQINEHSGKFNRNFFDSFKLSVEDKLESAFADGIEASVGTTESKDSEDGE